MKRNKNKLVVLSGALALALMALAALLAPSGVAKTNSGVRAECPLNPKCPVRPTGPAQADLFNPNAVLPVGQLQQAIGATADLYKLDGSGQPWQADLTTPSKCPPPPADSPDLCLNGNQADLFNIKSSTGPMGIPPDM